MWAEFLLLVRVQFLNFLFKRSRHIGSAPTQDSSNISPEEGLLTFILRHID